MATNYNDINLNYEHPTLPTFEPLEYPKYEPPTRDLERVKKLTQEAAAPQLRGLRTEVQRAMGKRYANPNVARMTLREALAGYGQGLESVMAGARAAGRSAYETEYAPLAEKARVEYQTGVSKAQQEWEAQRAARMTEYESAIKEYLASPVRTIPKIQYGINYPLKWQPSEAYR